MKLSQGLLRKLLFDTMEKAISKGSLLIVTPEGDERLFKGDMLGSNAKWQIYDWKTIYALVTRGDIGLGETYTQKLWDSEDLVSLYQVLLDNMEYLERYANGKLLSKVGFYILNYLVRRNSIRGSRNNISSHYDVGNDFYRLWLDSSMTYSSGLYNGKDISLEDAQNNKYQRILNIINEQENILEIGCGWGGFVQAAYGVGHKVTGLTVSEQQYAFAKERLGQDADIRLEDYRAVKGIYDSIVSIEMFEAVGKQYWSTYFATLKKRLSKNGVAMIQTITISEDIFDDYAKNSDYIRHYVFPGGMLPSVLKFKNCAEKFGLVCKNIFTFGQDYAQTLREWLQRFAANEIHIRQMGYSEEFVRSWRLYISMCAASFSCNRTNVMQVELVHG